MNGISKTLFQMSEYVSMPRGFMIWSGRECVQCGAEIDQEEPVFRRCDYDEGDLGDVKTRLCGACCDAVASDTEFLQRMFRIEARLKETGYGLYGL